MKNEETVDSSEPVGSDAFAGVGETAHFGEQKPAEMGPEPASLSETGSPQDRAYVSPWIRAAAAWSWRILLILAAVALLLWIARYISEIIIALALALLLALLLAPMVSWMRNKWRVPALLAAAIGLVIGVLVVGDLLYLAVTQLWRQASILLNDSFEGIQRLINWVGETFGIRSTDISDWADSVSNSIADLLFVNYSVIASEAVSLASLLVKLVTSALIMLFTLFFLLKDGRQIWVWFVRCTPKQWREQINEAGIRGWYTLTAYVRTQIQVAALDAVGIGLGALCLQLPALVPIVILVFLGAFVPIVGAFLSGAVAVLIALVAQGPLQALIMLIVVLGVQFLEGHVFQPLLMSNAVSLHPVATVLVVAIGTTIAGIPGALFAVPIAAFLNTVFLYLHGHDPFPHLATDPKRAGGPPGSLETQIKSSYGDK